MWGKGKCKARLVTAAELIEATKLVRLEGKFHKIKEEMRQRKCIFMLLVSVLIVLMIGGEDPTPTVSLHPKSLFGCMHIKEVGGKKVRAERLD